MAELAKAESCKCSAVSTFVLRFRRGSMDIGIVVRYHHARQPFSPYTPHGFTETTVGVLEQWIKPTQYSALPRFAAQLL